MSIYLGSEEIIHFASCDWLCFLHMRKTYVYTWHTRTHMSASKSRYTLIYYTYMLYIGYIYIYIYIVIYLHMRYMCIFSLYIYTYIHIYMRTCRCSLSPVAPNVTQVGGWVSATVRPWAAARAFNARSTWAERSFFDGFPTGNVSNFRLTLW